MQVGEVRVADDEDFRKLKELCEQTDGWKLEYHKHNTFIWTKNNDLSEFKIFKVSNVFIFFLIFTFSWGVCVCVYIYIYIYIYIHTYIHTYLWSAVYRTLYVAYISAPGETSWKSDILVRGQCLQ